MCAGNCGGADGDGDGGGHDGIVYHWRINEALRMAVYCTAESSVLLSTINGDYTASTPEKRQTERKPTFSERSQLKYARRLVVKLGSAVITREDNHGLALGRLASIVEQVAECHLEGREVMMVTSGAVAFGKQKLAQELLMSLSMHPRAAAAVGQSGLMSLYDAMFAQYGVKIAQVLVTKPDFYNEETRTNLFATLSELISLNIVPIINTNDAVSPPMFLKDDDIPPGTKKGIPIKDNDSLSAMLSAEVQADLLILMSDVDGIYNKPPWEDGAKLMHTYTTNDSRSIQFGQKSKIFQGFSSYNIPEDIDSIVDNNAIVETFRFRIKQFGAFVTTI
uniref:AA_kinase domain-containing protein n=1 Tax=Glossina austeni TaxID=7395 RepID=A0A1A9UJJ7_GLOAU